MNQTNLTFRIDNDVKQQADELYKSLGLNLSTAINMFLRQSIYKNGIPFEITGPKYKPEVEARLLQAMKDFDEGKGMKHELIGEDE